MKAVGQYRINFFPTWHIWTNAWERRKQEQTRQLTGELTCVKIVFLRCVQGRASATTTESERLFLVETWLYCAEVIKTHELRSDLGRINHLGLKLGTCIPPFLMVVAPHEPSYGNQRYR